MQRVHTLETQSQINDHIEENIKPLIKTEMSKALEKMPNSFNIMNKWYYFIFLFIFGITLIPVIWHFIQRNKQRKTIKENVEIDHIYKLAINQIDGLEFVKFENDKNFSLLKQYRVHSIPSDATITKATRKVFIRLFDKYNLEIRSGNAHWVRGGGKYRQDYNLPTGYIIFKGNIPNWNSFNYSISNKKKLLGNKSYIKLESDEFNKQFGFAANDPVKARMLYTPLCMEKTIAQNKIVNLHWWKINKTKDFFKIIFQPRNWSEIELTVNFRFKNDIDSLTTDLINGLEKSVFLIYKILGIIIIPPML